MLTFREWYAERQGQYRTAAEGMHIPEYIRCTLDDLSRAFMDYADIAIAEKLKALEAKEK